MKKLKMVEFVTKRDNFSLNVSSILEKIEKNQIKGQNKVVVPAKKAEIKFDYPLETECTIKAEATGEGFTREELARVVHDSYKTIYAIEDGTFTEELPSSFVLNRGKSNGTFGIWGHSLGDLYLEFIEYTVEDGVAKIELGIGS